MTPNEKRALIKFNEIKQGNTVAIAGALRVTIGYAGDVCKKLCEKGYLERLLPGQFAVYKITSIGEEQAKEEGASEKEIGVGAGAEEEKVVGPSEEILQDDTEGQEGEEIEEYECTNCGAVVEEGDTECPKCGMVFEGYAEEPEEERLKRESFLRSGAPGSEESFASAQDKLREEAVQPTPQTPEGNEGNVVQGNDNVDGKMGILNHPSVPED